MKPIWRTLTDLLSGRTPPASALDGAEALSPRAPPGEVVYAIGDIHGRADLLAPLLAAIWRDIEVHQVKKPVVVPLGDYVDRGPESVQVLELLLAARDTGEVEFRPLMGNHEQIMLAFLDDATVGPAWVRHGGAETLRSYGVVAPAPPAQETELWRRVQAAFVKALPKRHRLFLEELEVCHERGDYFFVHAGVRPGVALADQKDTDLLWIRAPFLQDARGLEKIVVHGHTPEMKPMFKDCRIGLDTGAYATGRLSAVRLEGDARKVLQAQAGASGLPSVEWFDEGDFI
jgi:serine/threonine protein phosphatase 1